MARSIPKAAALLVAISCLSISSATINNSQHNNESSTPLSASLPSASLPSASSSDVATTTDNVNYLRTNRRLSEALPNGGCQLTWPKKPDPPVAITYAASYPGCGARMTWNLVEALTGLETGDDWNNNGRGKEVVTVKTHYPQSNGILVEFDEEIQRGFIVIRNPMKSIPSFFNHIYEMRNHLPVHSERAPLEEWVKWRNAYLDTEIAEYKKFICYWMDRYTAENRLLMTYEGLTDDLIGPEVAKSLNEFLGQVPGVEPIHPDSVACVWRAVVKNQPPPQQAEQIARLQAAAVNQAGTQSGVVPQQDQPQPQVASSAVGVSSAVSQQQPLSATSTGGYAAAQRPVVASNVRRRRLDPGHHDSQRKGPEVPRPYTPEELDKMMNMLQEVAIRYQSGDVRLYHIMMGYYEKIRVERLKLSPDGVATPPGGFF